MTQKKYLLIIILEGVIIIFLGISLLILASQKEKTAKEEILPIEQVARQAIDYINKHFMQGETKAELLSFSEESGIYKIQLKIQDKQYTSYVTKNGKYLFPEAIDLLPPKPKEFPKTTKPDVKLFVMAFCPFGNQAEEMLASVADLLKNKANFELHYIFYSNYASGYPQYCYDKENKYCSMHGIGELNQGLRELCVAKYQKEKFWSFVKEINKRTNSKNVDQKWEEVAQSVGIDVEKIKECFQKEAKTLLENEIKLTEQMYPVQNPSFHKGEEKISISASPTLLINGIVYDGPRSAQDFKEAICSAFKNPPKECEINLSSNTPQSAGGSCQ